MRIEINFTEELTNTQFAPLAVLSAHYQQNQTLESLQKVRLPMKTRDFSPVDKLVQILMSILAGCGPLYEINTKLKPEVGLARIWGWDRFSDQSNLSRVLDALTLKQIEQLRQSATTIWRATSRARRHDWRGYLWLDFDLSGLPCSPRAEESQKGYFSGKKTSLDANWPASVPSNIEKRFGPTYILATAIL